MKFWNLCIHLFPFDSEHFQLINVLNSTSNRRIVKKKVLLLFNISIYRYFTNDLSLQKMPFFSCQSTFFPLFWSLLSLQENPKNQCTWTLCYPAHTHKAIINLDLSIVYLFLKFLNLFLICSKSFVSLSGIKVKWKIGFCDWFIKILSNDKLKMA